MRRALGVLLLFFLLWSFFGLSHIASAQKIDTADIKTAQEAESRLDEARGNLKEIQQLLTEPEQPFTEVQFDDLRNRLIKLQAQAIAVDSTLSPALESSKARLAELGQIAADVPEAEELKRQRDNLTSEVATIDGQLKIARLIAVEVKQSLEDLGLIRKAQFQAVLSQRYLSPFSSESQQQIKADLAPDLRATQQIFNELIASVEHISLGLKWLLSALAVLWVFSLRYVWRRFIRYLLKRTQSTRLRRSLLAAFVVGLYVLLPTGVVLILLSILTKAEGLSAELSLIAPQFVAMVAFAFYMAGLGRALLSVHKPTWRLPPLADPVAKALGRLPLVLTGFIILMWPIQKVTSLVSVNLSTLLVVNSVFALGLNAIVGVAVWRVHKHSDGAMSRLSRLALRAVALAIISSIVVWLFGYIALSHFIIQEVLWLGVIVFTAYLLLCLVEDVATAILKGFQKESELQKVTERQLHTRGQFVLLVSGLLKIALILLTLLLIFQPFGEDPAVWLQRRLTFLLQGFSFGAVTIKPTVLFHAVLVLVVGVWVVQRLQRWLVEKYLPYTGLGQGMSVSTARLISYVGYTLVGVLALSTAGIGFERLAWIVSALSVGIGFGLQAVVQNFVSGLLLLAERPIKVGDWISIGTGVEGNVRQINARATEIELFDRSTVIVPNSELITKTVRNVTLSNPIARARITVIMPVNVSAELVRQCLFDAVASTEEVLKDPESLVIIDGFEAGGIAYSLYIFLSSPRLINKVRSEVFFKVLANFEKSNLSLHPTQRMEIVEQAVADKKDD